jgi:hypothetical protein
MKTVLTQKQAEGEADTDTIGAEGLASAGSERPWRLRSRPIDSAVQSRRESWARATFSLIFSAAAIPAEILAPGAAAEIVVQRPIDAGFQISRRRGSLPKSPLSQFPHNEVASLPWRNL